VIIVKINQEQNNKTVNKSNKKDIYHYTDNNSTGFKEENEDEQ
jgi:hypothetical protein